MWLCGLGYWNYIYSSNLNEEINIYLILEE